MRDRGDLHRRTGDDRRRTVVALAALALALCVGVPATDAQAQTAPTLTGLDPANAPASGGTTVTLTGTGFVDVLAVRIGNITTDVACSSDTSCRIITPIALQGSGTFDLTVLTQAGRSNALPFTFLQTPVITGTSPDIGPEAGGTIVTLRGSGFFPGATGVTFGGAPGINVECEPTECFVTSPPGTGVVDLLVTTAEGTSNPSDFSYQAAASPMPETGASSAALIGVAAASLGVGFAAVLLARLRRRPA